MSGLELLKAQQEREHETKLAQWKVEVEQKLEHWKTENHFKLEQWKHECQLGIESLNWTIGFANITIKALLLANGGALITLLAFIGNAKDKEALLKTLMPSIQLFLLGTFVSILVSGMAYSAQYSFTHKHNKTGIFFQIISIAAALGSWLCFGLGAYLATEIYK